MQAFIKGLTPKAKSEVFNLFQPKDGVKALHQVFTIILPHIETMNYDILLEADTFYHLTGYTITCIGVSDKEYVRISNADYVEITFS